MIFFSQLESFFLQSSLHNCKSQITFKRIMTKCILNRCRIVKLTANKRSCASYFNSVSQNFPANSEYFLKAKIPFYNIEVKISALYYSSIQLTFYLHIHKKYDGREQNLHSMRTLIYKQTV